ncbi:MAG: ImmA/IrrE family metallo-endopeptidase [Bifidobacterium longum]|nr:ImmA/IrrE family metallo-endopeptidase [Bifidobacterium longum]
MRMALYDVAPELNVSSALLPGILDGIYCLETNTILIDRRITYTRKRCTLVHELVHWRHGDDTTSGCMGGKMERRCRRETAILLIDPAEYALAERMYDGDPYQMAAELNVTVQIIEDYRALLYEHVR